MRGGGDLGRAISEPRPFDLAGAPRDPASGDHPRPLRPIQAELMAAGGAALLLVSLLFLKWFGIGGAVGRFAPRVDTTGSEGAWHTLTLLRWLALVAIVVAFLPLLVRPAGRWLGLPRRTNAAVATLGALTMLLLGYRVLIDLPDPSHVVDQKAGAILGLLGALLIGIGGLESMRAHTTHAKARRGRARSRRSSVPPGEIARAPI